MPDYLFIFFAGIAFTMGLSYVVLGIFKKVYQTNFIFGLFALSAGIYYLLIPADFNIPRVDLFFATVMFILFPWYLANESGYLNKKLLWLITVLGITYYLVSLSIFSFSFPKIQYLFSYSVYLLTAWYCIGCIKQIVQRKNTLLWPFLFVSVYYTLFVAEEIAFDQFGNMLPWRNYLSFMYLDFFPLIIIGMKGVILTYDQLLKVKLEKSINVYKENLDVILNLTKKFVLSLDMEGNILFANPFFLKFYNSRSAVLNKNLDQFLLDDSQKEFTDVVFNKETQSGSIVSQIRSPKGILTVVWSFVKLKDEESSINFNYIVLFGANITQLKQTEENLEKAFTDLEVLKNKLKAENIQLLKSVETSHPQEKLIGQSPNFIYVLNRIEDVASIEVPVLLEGETGVGKELFANAIHERSKRKGKPFIKVNCSAIPAELIESELFGFEKGAFTGADRLKKGMFELADQGTLFLDEIGDLPMALQPKLLRALQEGEIQRLGAENVIKINIRIVAATNRSLEEEVEKGRFRSDLYYRLNVFPITIPPLRQRKSDIPFLVKAFVNSFNTKYHKHVNQISESLMDDLTNYSWPGNIRQLRNVIERALITSSETILKLSDPLPLQTEINSNQEIPYLKKSADSITLEECERIHISNVLEKCGWKISGKSSASEILDLPSSTLRSKMKKLGIKAQNKSN